MATARREIHIEITPNGEVKLTVVGVAGEGCLELTRALEEELGVVLDREKTSGYYQVGEADRTINVGED